MYLCPFLLWHPRSQTHMVSIENGWEVIRTTFSLSWFDHRIAIYSNKMGQGVCFPACPQGYKPGHLGYVRKLNNGRKRPICQHASHTHTHVHKRGWTCWSIKEITGMFTSLSSGGCTRFCFLHRPCPLPWLVSCQAWMVETGPGSELQKGRRKRSIAVEHSDPSWVRKAWKRAGKKVRVARKARRGLHGAPVEGGLEVNPSPQCFLQISHIPWVREREQGPGRVKYPVAPW